MLAIKSKLAIARLIVIVFGLTILIVSLFLQSPTSYISWATLFFAIAILLAGFLEITYPRGGRITAAPALILATIYILNWPSALIASVAGAIVTDILKSSRFNLMNLLITVSKTTIIVFLTSITFLLAYVKPIIEINNQTMPLIKILIPAFLTTVIFFALNIAFEQMFYAFSKGASFIPVFVGSARNQAPIFLTFSIISLLMALMFQPKMKFWSIILFSLPLIVTGHSFKLYLNIRRAYQDTITALVNTIEAQDIDNRGHAERVAEYCVDIAREMGLYGKKLENVSYAALLHDIGNLGFEAGTKAEEVFVNNEEIEINHGIPLHALVGADIVGQVDYLKNVTGLVKYHHLSFQDVIKNRTEKRKFPVGARIIQVASDFDKFTNNNNPNERLDYKSALKKLKKDQGYIYDPRVIRAMRNVLKKQGKLIT